MLSDFELAEVLWEAVEPCLSEIERDEMSAALHSAEPVLAIVVVLRAVTQCEYPIPLNVFQEFRTWLATLAPLNTSDRWLPAWLELHVLASDIRVSPRMLKPIGGYGPATLCFFIVDDAGLIDAPDDQQAEVLRGWLKQYRPSPALRADMRACGFGYLLDE